ncbi:hypothetical protein ACFQER_15755 [Halomicroarcula sp. GCM10025894]
MVRPISQVDDGHSYPAVEEAITVTLTPKDSMSEGESMSDDDEMN